MSPVRTLQFTRERSSFSRNETGSFSQSLLYSLKSYRNPTCYLISYFSSCTVVECGFTYNSSTSFEGVKSSWICTLILPAIGISPSSKTSLTPVWRNSNCSSVRLYSVSLKRHLFEKCLSLQLPRRLCSSMDFSRISARSVLLLRYIYFDWELNSMRI